MKSAIGSAAENAKLIPSRRIRATQRDLIFSGMMELLSGLAEGGPAAQFSLSNRIAESAGKRDQESSRDGNDDGMNPGATIGERWIP